MWGSYSRPRSCAWTPKASPLSREADPAEVLFHELVHAFNAVTGTPYDRKLYTNPFVPAALKKDLPQYDNEDDFFAILITNIFASETGRTGPAYFPTARCRWTSTFIRETRSPRTSLLRACRNPCSTNG